MLFLQQGAVQCTVAKGKDPFSIETPAAKITALGTKFTVDVWDEGGRKMKMRFAVGTPIVGVVEILVGPDCHRSI